ncbi:MAG: hypothetical protein AB8G14_19385 [Ilumatobacter sp.]
MNSKISSHLGALCAAALIALAACGGTPSDADAIEQLSRSFQGGADSPDLADDEANCVSTEIVASLGAERSLEIDSTDLDGSLPLAEAETVTDAFLGCIDTKAFFTDIINEDPGAAAIPQAFVDCLIDQLDGDVIRSVFVAEFSGQGDSNALGEAFGAEAGAACIEVLTPEEIEQLAGS